MEEGSNEMQNEMPFSLRATVIRGRLAESNARAIAESGVECHSEQHVEE
jgi:hypothetical protein